MEVSRYGAIRETRKLLSARSPKLQVTSDEDVTLNVSSDDTESSLVFMEYVLSKVGRSFKRLRRGTGRP